jgi:hypothetical protein
VMLNFTGKTAAVSTPFSSQNATTLLCNYVGSVQSVKIELRPYEAIVYQLK